MTRNEQLAYLAGIIDGEGCVGAWNRRSRKEARPRHAELTIRVSMTTPFAVQLLHEVFGGSLFAERKPRGNRRQAFAWVVCNRKAEDCLRALLPYLREKREQALVAIAMEDFNRQCRLGKGRSLTAEQFAEHTKFVDKLKDLKRVEYDPTVLN